MVRMLVCGLLLWTGAVSGQTMYKCKGADGTYAFTQQPCADNAEAIELKVVAPPPEAIESANREFQVRAGLTSLQYEERNCIDRARRSVYDSVDRRISGHRQRIRRLEAELQTANNNLAGATFGAGIREQIAGLHQAIATEQSSADSMFTAAEQRCVDARLRKEEEARTAAAATGG
jgi:hypothetical protein